MWFLLAVIASMLWGVTYAISGHLFKTLSVPTLLLFSSSISAIVMLIASLVSRTLVPDVQKIVSSRETALWLACFVVAIILANVAISYSIVASNATLAAVIEIAYPVFTVLAAWLLFGERQLNAATFAGGLLIFAGAAVISLKAA